MKIFYADQAQFYNSTCFEGEGYSPICLPTTSPPPADADQVQVLPASADQPSDRKLAIVELWTSNSTTVDLSALEDKLMQQVQAKLDAFKAQVDVDEVATAEKLMTKMNDISNNLTTSLSELQVNTTKCFQELNSSMKQFMREAIDEYAAIKLNAPHH